MSSQYEYPSITFDASSRQSAELMFFPPADGLTGSIVRLSLSAMSLLEGIILIMKSQRNAYR